MRHFTNAKTINYSNALINAIKIFMEDNNLTEVSLKDTIFHKKGGWKSLIIVDDELLILHEASYFTKKDFTHNFEFVSLIDIINLQEVVMDKIYSMFSF